jgi:RNA polymerase sigma-70 factor (ECF subfamily)
MQMDRENEIIVRVKAGVTNEFEHLVRRYQGPLFRIVANLVDRPMVEDIVQDIFLTAFIQIHRFDPRRGAFRTWLYRIARNRALNARRKKREQLMDKVQVLKDGRTPDHDLMTREAYDALDRVVSELEYKDRVIFVLAELEGLTYAQIAEIESIALGTVKSRLSRVRVKLRRALKKYVE